MRNSGIGRLVALAAVVTVAFFVVALLARPKNTTGPCTVISRAMLPDVPEASGLAISRHDPGLIWTHNDSGNAAALFAIDAAGRPRGHVRVPAQLRDWEAMSAAPCDSLRLRSGPASSCLFLGDIGDNSRARSRVQVLVVPEPAPGDADTPRPDVYAVSYPDGAHNAEAMFVTGGRLFIITRDRVGTLYGSVAPLGEDHAITLRRISQLGLSAVTDAETSPDATSVVVRTSHEVRIYRTGDLIGGGVTPRVKIPIDGVREPQGEGVAIGEGGMLYLASEGGILSRAGRLVTLRCNLAL
jgi:hypothetical protein